MSFLSVWFYPKTQNPNDEFAHHSDRTLSESEARAQPRSEKSVFFLLVRFLSLRRYQRKKMNEYENLNPVKK